MAETYVHNGTEFKNAQQIYGNVSGTFQEVNAAYANVGGTFKLVFSAFQATSFVTLSSGTGFQTDAGKIHLAFADGTNMNEIALDTLGGVINTASISDNAITTAKISDNQIVTAKISDNQITTVKVSDLAITTAKISNNAITSDKLLRKFTITTNITPAGGADGDLWFVYS